MNLAIEIRDRVADGRFEFSQHAVDQSIVRRISVEEIRSAIRTAEVIEEYPEDKYGPSCLLYGTTAAGRPLHIQCSHPSRAVVKIITVYEPDPKRWIRFRERRRE